MVRYCVVCGKKFVPKKDANLCCSECGWSQIDAIFAERDKFDLSTGKKKNK